MQWISKSPPMYVWEEDTWLREMNPGYKKYSVDLNQQAWVSEDDKFLFTKKTKVLKENA